jgi:hypothetical protein
MKQFKVRFPGGYQVDDIFNDNIDLNVILPDGRVFFATAFTILNIQYLIEKDQDIYFWATDMFVVKDLEKITIKKSIEKIIADDYFEMIFCKIGYLETVYSDDLAYNEVIDESDAL